MTHRNINNLADKTAWVVIPAFNEAGEDTVSRTVLSVKRCFRNVVVVDDGSSDETSALALAAGAYVCRHPVNLGQGASLATGIAFALARGGDAIVTFDADGQHSPHNAFDMLGLLRRERLDIVLGSRFLGSALGIPFHRKMFLRAATLFTIAATGLPLTDTHNGLRVLSRNAAALIRISQNRMAHASEILHQIAAHHLAFREYPVTIEYTQYSMRKGHRLTGAVRILGDLFIRKLMR